MERATDRLETRHSQPLQHCNIETRFCQPTILNEESKLFESRAGVLLYLQSLTFWTFKSLRVRLNSRLKCSKECHVGLGFAVVVERLQQDLCTTLLKVL
jgi:hypothetical protein